MPIIAYHYKLLEDTKLRFVTTSFRATLPLERHIFGSEGVPPKHQKFQNINLALKAILLDTEFDRHFRGRKKKAGATPVGGLQKEMGVHSEKGEEI